MAKYLLIESRDPFEVNDVEHYWNVARDLASDGNEVTLFLVQNGVLPARKSIHSDPLTKLGEAGVKVLADDFSLRERGIGKDRMAAGIEAAPLDVVIDHMEQGSKVLWH